MTGDLWLFPLVFSLRLHDLPLPMPNQRQMAGDTPVITLTTSSIPAGNIYRARSSIAISTPY